MTDTRHDPTRDQLLEHRSLLRWWFRRWRANAVVAEDLPGPGTVFLEVHWRFKAPVRPGDVITGRVEVRDVREDKPITKLDTRVTRGDGTVVLEGDAVCYTMKLS